jgi:hypothetical protein
VPDAISAGDNQYKSGSIIELEGVTVPVAALTVNVLVTEVAAE